MRNQGQGHIRRGGRESWELKFDLGRDPLSGKRKIRYASFKGTKRQAQAELNRLISENAAGAGVDPSKVTLAEFLERWLRDWASINVSPKTLERYRQLVKNQIVPNIGAVAVQKLRPVHLSEAYAKLSHSGLSARTVGHVHRLLHRVLGHAATWAAAQQNVAALVHPPRVTASEINILTEDQIGMVLRHFAGRTIRPIVALGLATGARRGELLALRLKDVDFAAGTIRIERSIEQTKAGLRFKAPKTRNGRRTISIPASIVTELRAHCATLAERQLALGVRSDLLFPRWDGKVRSPHWLTQKFALAMTALRIDGVTLHSLRHTHASQLIAGGNGCADSQSQARPWLSHDHPRGVWPPVLEH